MKLEYLAYGSDDCPLLRMFGFTSQDLQSLETAIASLARGNRGIVAVHEEPYVESLDGCRLLLQLAVSDRGVIKLPSGNSFTCLFTADGWENVADLIHPFIDSDSGYQWLTTAGETKWLLSKSGRW